MPTDDFRDEVIDRLARIEEKLNGFSSLTKTAEDHEDRLRVLERSHYKSLGWAAAVSLAVTIAVPFLAASFHIHLG